jgi:hypothetical protein
MDETDAPGDRADRTDGRSADRRAGHGGQRADSEAGPDGGRARPDEVAEAVEGVEYESGGGNVAGPGPGASLGPVEPGSPTLEGAVFVLLGAALTVLVLAQLAGL